MTAIPHPLTAGAVDYPHAPTPTPRATATKS